MLSRSFLFLPGVDAESERRFWSEGITTWIDFEAALPDLPYPPQQKRRWLRRLARLETALTEANSRLFARYLPLTEHWRMLADFLPATAFIDVEAYQLQPGHYQITVVGVLSQQGYKTFIRGQNLADLPAYLDRFRLVISFGGNRFDIKVIKASFNLDHPPYVFIDFQNLYARLGLPQGLKKLERLFGWRRGHGLDGIGGWAAVYLWERHCEGDDRALPALIRYNFADVIHLPVLAVYAYNELIRKEAYPFVPLARPRIRARPPRFDASIVSDIRRARPRSLRRL